MPCCEGCHKADPRPPEHDPELQPVWRQAAADRDHVGETRSRILPPGHRVEEVCRALGIGRQGLWKRAQKAEAQGPEALAEFQQKTLMVAITFGYESDAMRKARELLTLMLPIERERLAQLLIAA